MCNLIVTKDGQTCSTEHRGEIKTSRRSRKLPGIKRRFDTGLACWTRPHLLPRPTSHLPHHLQLDRTTLSHSRPNKRGRWKHWGRWLVWRWVSPPARRSSVCCVVQRDLWCFVFLNSSWLIAEGHLKMGTDCSCLSRVCVSPRMILCRSPCSVFVFALHRKLQEWGEKPSVYDIVDRKTMEWRGTRNLCVSVCVSSYWGPGKTSMESIPQHQGIMGL